jgi:outer membrane immunogenic protein
MGAMMMKRLIAALALVFAVPFGAAMAADMPVKAPPPVLEYNWSGIYWGVNAGYSWESFDWQYTNPSPPGCCPGFNNANVNQGIGGVHGGVQYQWNHVVFGIEAAGDAYAQEKWAGGPGCLVPNSATISCQARNPGFLTAGGRLGWAWGDWLVFGSGGWAITNEDTRLVNANGTQFDYSGGSGRADGWYVGVGVEYVVYKGGWADLIAGAEYQHLDFGTVLLLSPLDGYSQCPPGVNCRNVSNTEDIFRVRLSAKINPWPYAPVVAKY